MKIKNPFQSATKKFISKEIENQLYAKASEDMEKNQIHKGIWTRAFAKSEGNENKQKAIYIELMVQHYKDEIAAGEEIEKILMSETEKELAKKAEENQRQQEAEQKKQAEKAWNHPDAVAARAKQNKAVMFVLIFIGIGLISLFIMIVIEESKETQIQQERIEEFDKCMKSDTNESREEKFKRCINLGN